MKLGTEVTKSEQPEINTKVDADLDKAINVQHQHLCARNNELIDTGYCMRPVAKHR